MSGDTVAPLTVGSACSGVGCIDLGLKRAGFSTAWMIERSPRRRSILRRHFPTAQILEDLYDAPPDELPRVDVLAAGTPCQDFSVAGRRAGMAGERSGGLFARFIGLADAMPAAWLLWENVPGVFYSNRGADFAVCLEGFTGARFAVPSRGWRNAGFAVGPLRWCVWRVLDAQHFGVPQRRRRVFVVAGPRDRPAPGVLLEPGCRGSTTGEGEEEGHEATIVSSGSVGSGGVAPSLMGRRQKGRLGARALAVDLTQITNPQEGSRATRLSPTLACSNEIGVFEPGAAGVRVLTGIERERLQGLPDDWTRWGAEGEEMSRTARRRMTGDGAAVPVIEWIGRRLGAAIRGYAESPGQVAGENPDL